jgi:hypothetical protein
LSKKYHQWLFVVTALCAVANGVAYLFFPVSSLALLGVRPDGYGLAITRYYGACALGWGWLLWLGHKSTRAIVVRAISGSILLILGTSALVGAQAVMAGVFEPLGWLLVSVDASLSVGALYNLVRLRGLEWT